MKKNAKLIECFANFRKISQTVWIGCAGAHTRYAIGSGGFVSSATCQYGRCADFCQLTEFQRIGSGEEHVERRYFATMFTIGVYVRCSKLSWMQRTNTIFKWWFATRCSWCGSSASTNSWRTSISQGIISLWNGCELSLSLSLDLRAKLVNIKNLFVFLLLVEYCRINNWSP